MTITFTWWSSLSTKFPFHEFWKTSIPYSRFSRIYKTDLPDFSARGFSKFAKFKNCEFPKMFFGGDLGFLMCWGILWCIQNQEWRCPLAPEVMQITTFAESPKKNHNNSTELLSYSKFKKWGKSAPRPPQTPIPEFFHIPCRAPIEHLNTVLKRQGRGRWTLQTRKDLTCYHGN